MAIRNHVEQDDDGNRWYVEYQWGYFATVPLCIPARGSQRARHRWSREETWGATFNVTFKSWCRHCGIARVTYGDSRDYDQNDPPRGRVTAYYPGLTALYPDESW